MYMILYCIGILYLLYINCLVFFRRHNIILFTVVNMNRRAVNNIVYNVMCYDINISILPICWFQ